MDSPRLRDLLITAIAPVTWGSVYLVTRQWLPTGMPLMGAVLRALPAGLLLLLIVRRLPQGGWWWRSALISVLTVGGFFVLIFVAAQRLPSGVAATLMACGAIVSLVLGRLVLGERASVLAYVGGAVGIAGVALLVGGAAGGLDPWGVLASLSAMLASSVGYVLTKLWRPPVPPLTFVAWQLTMGGLMVLPVALLVDGPPPPMDAAAVAGFVYIGLVATAVANACWFRGLALLPVGTVGLVGLLNPLSGSLLGMLIAHERLTPVQMAGALAIVAGVAAGTLPRRPSLSR